jgi:hypothetical protein
MLAVGGGPLGSPPLDKIFGAPPRIIRSTDRRNHRYSRCPGTAQRNNVTRFDTADGDTRQGGGAGDPPEPFSTQRRRVVGLCEGRPDNPHPQVIHRPARQGMQGIQMFGGVCRQSDDGPGTHQSPNPLDRKIALAHMDSVHRGPCCPRRKENVHPVIHQNGRHIPNSFSSPQDQLVQGGSARTFFADLDNPDTARNSRPDSLHDSPVTA